ncbi:hypothetical protein V6Z11_D06G181400 [Gossypium hirsutum]
MTAHLLKSSLTISITTLDFRWGAGFIFCAPKLWGDLIQLQWPRLIVGSYALPFVD